MTGIRINNAVKHLNRGGLIIFGTDTVNGIGCLFDKKEAIKQIFKIKKRNSSKPLVLLMSDYNMAKQHLITNELSDHLVNAYMPGKLTILLYAKNKGNKYLVKNRKTAFRIPKRNSLRKLINDAGKPLASTSLNISGQETINSRKDIRKMFPDIPIFNNLTRGSRASTIIDATNNKIKYLRKGEIIIRGHNGTDKSL